MKIQSLKFILTGLLIGWGMISCVQDLEPKSLLPLSVTATDAYKTPADFRMGLAKLYGSFAMSGQFGPSGSADISNLDDGFGVYLRGYFNLQELPTDEGVYSWAEDGTIRPLHWQTWTPTNSFNTAMYTRIMLTVAYCNEFIRVSEGSEDADVKKYHAEARYLRALAYFHALDFYGSPPFVTEADTPGSFFPKQTTPTELFAYIDSELTAIEADLGEPKFEYARADKGALWMLQAKLYLNATSYGIGAKYTECLTAVNKVISSGQYSLAPNYLANFTADNNLSPEIIFPIAFDAKNTQSYGGTAFIVHGSIGGSMVPTDYGVNGGWAQNRVTPEFVGKFPDPSGATDKRARFYTNGQSLDINDVGSFTDGYAVTKFTNKTLAGGAAPSGGNPDFVDTDFPMFRLADAYLMYAEAVLRGGTGGTLAQALAYVNLVRERGFNAPPGNVAADITSGQLDLQFIIDERGRELYWECHRRTDLVRFGQLTGSDYLWQWKGNVKAGVSTDAHLNRFPIPAQDLAANPTLHQNPGYTD